jgi:hypothetical protein
MATKIPSSTPSSATPPKAASHRTNLEQAGGQVGGAEGAQLLVGVHRLVALGGQGLRQHGGVGHRDQGDAKGAAEQRAQVGQLDGREGQGRQALGQHPDDLDPLLGEVEGGNRNDAEHDGRHHPRERPPEPAQDEDHHDAGQADGQCRPVHLSTGDALDDVTGLGQQPAAVDREPAQPRELPNENRDRDPGQVAELHRARQQLGHEPKPGDAGDQDDQPGEDGQGAGGVGAEHHHPGRPEDGVDDQRHDGGVEPGDRGQPGRLGVAHANRDQHVHKRIHDSVGWLAVARHRCAASPSRQGWGAGRPRRTPRPVVGQRHDQGRAQEDDVDAAFGSRRRLRAGL